MALAVELVPRPLYGRNLRTELTPEEWRQLSYDVRARAGFGCQVCGCRPSSPPHCDEVWAYNDATHVATLVALRSICMECHDVKHMGHSVADKGAQGAHDFAMKRLMRVNGWDEISAKTHIERAWAAWRERNLHGWTLDLARWTPGRPGTAARDCSRDGASDAGQAAYRAAPLPPHEEGGHRPVLERLTEEEHRRGDLPVMFARPEDVEPATRLSMARWWSSVAEGFCPRCTLPMSRRQPSARPPRLQRLGWWYCSHCRHWLRLG